MAFNLQAPRPANPGEITAWGRIFPKLGNNFRILAPEQVEGSDGCYNCLGWALGQVINVLSFNVFSRDQLTARFAALGLVPCGEAEATIDVWFLPGEVYAEHVSKKDQATGRWTSKLGPDGPLIEHDRYALEGDDYGSVTLHFGPAPAGHAAHQLLSVQTIKPSVTTQSLPNVTEEDVAAVEGHAALFQSLAVAPKGITVPRAPAKVPVKAAPPKATPAKPAAVPVKPAPAKPTPAPTKPAPTKPASNPAKSAPVKPASPAKPAPGPSKQVPAKPTPTPTKPTTPATPAANPVAAQSEKAYTAWQATWSTPKVRVSSRDDAYKKSQAYKDLVKLGPAILPLLAAKLAKPNQIYAVIPWLELDKGAHKVPPTTDILSQKRAILSTSAATARSLAVNVSSFALNRDNVLSGAANGLKAAAELVNDPLFQQIVTRGAPAVAHILDDYARSGVHGKAIWIEGLKQIHSIETEHKGESFPEQMKEFETWLASYTGQPVPSEQPAADDAGTGTTAPAAQPAAGPATEPEAQPTTVPATEPEAEPTTVPEAAPEDAETAPQ